MSSTELGIDLLKAKTKEFIGSREVKTGVLCHPASVTKAFEHIVLILEKATKLTTFFGPQHGIYGETQDNMIEWEDLKDSQGRPIYSLYGKTRVPSDQSLREVQLMVIDLFDVGSRYYTFQYTMAYMMEVCAKLGIPVIVCDRPNPLGGELIEGPILDSRFRSFVGRYEIPVCHGMTIGELAFLFAEKMSPKPKIKIVPMKGWRRRMFWPDTKLVWTLPSPNMPNFEAALLYPGMCLLEASTLSEGRGTTRPFELIGAPFFEWDKIEREYQKLCRSLQLLPVTFHRQGFIPTFHKFAGQICRGALQISPNPLKFKPLRHAVTLLWIFRQLYGRDWDWTSPPYEYEFEKKPIDILMGGTETREVIDSGGSLKQLYRQWANDEKKFRRTRLPFLRYR